MTLYHWQMLSPSACESRAQLDALSCALVPSFPHTWEPIWLFTQARRMHVRVRGHDERRSEHDVTNAGMTSKWLQLVALSHPENLWYNAGTGFTGSLKTRILGAFG